MLRLSLSWHLPVSERVFVLVVFDSFRIFIHLRPLMENGPPAQKHLVRLLFATVGIVVLVIVWSRFGSGDSHPTEAGDSVEVTHSMHHSPEPATPAPAATLAATDPVEPAPPMPAEPPTTVPAASSRDDELKAHLLGIWLHAKNGHQWIEVRPDGTARMLLKLDPFSALLYGSHTVMDLTWELKDGVLSHTVVSGTPESHVESLIKDFGRTRRYKILETAPDRMLLEAQVDQKTQDQWTRSPAPTEWGEKPPESGM